MAEKSKLKFYKQFLDFSLDVYNKFSEDAVSFLAASISYYALLSLFPLILLALTFLAYYYGTEKGLQEIASYTKAFIPQFSSFIAANVQAATAAKRSLGVVSLAGLLWAGTAIFDAIEFSLNKIWQVKQPRHFVASKLLSLAFAIALVLFLISLTFISTFLDAFLSYFSSFALKLPYFYTTSLTTLLILLLDFGLFLFLYTIVPNKKLKFKDNFYGSLLAALLWESLKRLFSFYVAKIARYQFIYGSLGAAIGLLFWLYLSAFVLLLGAEVNAVIYKRSYS